MILYLQQFWYMDPTNKVAKDFPNVKFEHATGTKENTQMFLHTLQDFMREELY